MGRQKIDVELFMKRLKDAVVELSRFDIAQLLSVKSHTERFDYTPIAATFVFQ
jgi:hypothetical protein